jgi:hypothetical protein
MAEDLSVLNVAELKERLREAGLPVSGRKDELIARLEEAAVPTAVEASEVDADEAVAAPMPSHEDHAALTGKDAAMAMMRRESVLGLPFGAVVAVLLAVMMTAVALAAPGLLGFAKEPDWELIDFDATQAEAFAAGLVALGHPEWKGRMSGSAYEHAAAESILENFSSMGYQTQMHSYPVDMFSVNSEPSLRMCLRGLGGNSPCEGPLSIGSQITEFEHRIDYVIQGYSGSVNVAFQDNIPLVDLGDGGDDALWSDASGAVGIVDSGGTISGNTALFVKAIENDLAALVRVNTNYNCGKVEADDCVPIFKSVDTSAVKDANGGSMPDIAFIAVSNLTGQSMRDLAANNARLEMFIDVTNGGQLDVKVPCGTLQGTTSEVVLVGAHHDTVYSGPGAVDDTSGSASVLEMARQVAKIAEAQGTPERTVRFCTWGGEEEGLFGSRAYVQANGAALADDLRLYINLDMNHVDIDFSRGNSLSMFTNNEEDYDHIRSIWEVYSAERSDVADRYEVRFSLLDGPKGAENGMPYNSDHGPFVYDLPGGNEGQAVVCYGSGSYEYHTYADDMSRFNAESLGVSVTVYGTYLRWLAWG